MVSSLQSVANVAVRRSRSEVDFRRCFLVLLVAVFAGGAGAPGCPDSFEAGCLVQAGGRRYGVGMYSSVLCTSVLFTILVDSLWMVVLLRQVCSCSSSAATSEGGGYWGIFVSHLYWAPLWTAGLGTGPSFMESTACHGYCVLKVACGRCYRPCLRLQFQQGSPSVTWQHCRDGGGDVLFCFLEWIFFRTLCGWLLPSVSAQPCWVVWSCSITFRFDELVQNIRAMIHPSLNLMSE